MNNINYDNRFFVSKANTDNGEVGSDTIFHYRQKGETVWATYEGGQILFGTLVARIQADGSLDMRYQHVNRDEEFMTGRCHSTPEVLPNGRLRLYESWQWISGDQSSGESIIEEIER